MTHPCFISCNDCLRVCEFVYKNKLTNSTLEKLSLQLCIQACKKCILACNKHAAEYIQCANCVVACQECISWCSNEVTTMV